MKSVEIAVLRLRDPDAINTVIIGQHTPESTFSITKHISRSTLSWGDLKPYRWSELTGKDWFSIDIRTEEQADPIIINTLPSEVTIFKRIGNG